MVLIFFWIAFIVFDSRMHYAMIMEGTRIDHGMAGWLRVIIGSAFFLFFGSGGFYGMTIFLLSAFFSFWLIFNLYLNYLRGLGWFYLGESSFLDRLEHKARDSYFGAWGIIVLKAIMAIHFFWWYLHLTNYKF